MDTTDQLKLKLEMIRKLNEFVVGMAPLSGTYSGAELRDNYYQLKPSLILMGNIMRSAAMDLQHRASKKGQQQVIALGYEDLKLQVRMIEDIEICRRLNEVVVGDLTRRRVEMLDIFNTVLVCVGRNQLPV